MRAKAFLATIYGQAGRSADAINVINEALAVSDKRQQFYFVAAEAYLKANQSDQAVAALRQAYALAPEYPDAVVNLSTVLIITGKEDEAEALVLKTFGAKYIPDDRFAQAYVQAGHLEKAAKVLEVKTNSSSQDYLGRAQLGLLYARLGRVQDAIAKIEEAIQIQPQFKTQGEQLIEQIRSGQAGAKPKQ